MIINLNYLVWLLVKETGGHSLFVPSSNPFLSFNESIGTTSSRLPLHWKACALDLSNQSIPFPFPEQLVQRLYITQAREMTLNTWTFSAAKQRQIFFVSTEVAWWKYKVELYACSDWLPSWAPYGNEIHANEGRAGRQKNKLLLLMFKRQIQLCIKPTLFCCGCMIK